MLEKAYELIACFQLLHRAPESIAPDGMVGEQFTLLHSADGGDTLSDV